MHACYFQCPFVVPMLVPTNFSKSLTHISFVPMFVFSNYNRCLIENAYCLKCDVHHLIVNIFGSNTRKREKNLQMADRHRI
jgi:ribosomal protein S26